MDSHKILSDDIHLLHKIQTNRFLLSKKGMTELQRFTSFTEIRLHCTKKWHNRTVDIKTDNTTTNGRQAVDFLLGMNDDKPSSCNSYKRLEGDSSRLGANCELWYGGQWREPDMYHYPFYISNGKQNYFTLLSGILQCDDNVYNKEDKSKFSSIGTWSYFVR